MNTCRALLNQWCDTLLKLQVHNTENPFLDGGILCPACGRIHGRCFDAIYPLMYMADVTGNETYLKGAQSLFDWAEAAVSRGNGSYVNDPGSSWAGTTVFSVIQLAESLEYHGHLLDESTREKWKKRIAKAADYLKDYQEFEVCNVNYRITNSLAMELCGKVLGEESYRKRGQELKEMAVACLTEQGLLVGEGRPVDGFSSKRCRPVDIGYNVEESLPSLVQYAYETDDEELEILVSKALKYHLRFMLGDGAIDNSFGTRNYKWTYWGSRTSDGCLLGYLLAAEREPVFGVAAQKNLELLSSCTHGGILYAGPQMYQKGELPCIHHTFTHAKVLAAILDHGLESRLADGKLPREQMRGMEYLKEADTYLIYRDGWTATVTGYDWEYKQLPGGHASGGTMTLLWHETAGPLVAAGMCEYSLKEPGNMQLPRFSHHESLVPRLEVTQNGKLYSNIYDRECRIRNLKPDQWQNGSMDTAESSGTELLAEGILTDIGQQKLKENGSYQLHYVFSKNAVKVTGTCQAADCWILPIVSQQAEKVAIEENTVKFLKNGKIITISVERGKLELPYGTERIYQLVPGMEAVKIMILPENGEFAFCILF